MLERAGPDERWTATTLTADDTLNMPDIGIAIPVAEFYEGIEFADIPASAPV